MSQRYSYNSLGWFIKSIHRWSSGIMVVCLILHISRVYFTGGFIKPREFIWITAKVHGIISASIANLFGYCSTQVNSVQKFMYSILNQKYKKLFTTSTKGFILLPHLGSLALATGPGGEITDIYSYFIISILHLISSGALALGGVYHAIFGPERLEETYYGNIFGYQWQDRFRITAILGAHLITLGFSSLLLQTKSTYFGGLYDTCHLVVGMYNSSNTTPLA